MIDVLASLEVSDGQVQQARSAIGQQSPSIRKGMSGYGHDTKPLVLAPLRK